MAQNGHTCRHFKMARRGEANLVDDSYLLIANRQLEQRGRQQ
jgi:hypothetical protein